MAAILAHREVAPLLSDEHFSVDGTLVKAWASMKSFQPKERATSDGDDNPGDPPDTSVLPASSSNQSTAEPDPMIRPTRRNRNAEVDFRGEQRSNATHASRTDPEARLPFGEWPAVFNDPKMTTALLDRLTGHVSRWGGGGRTWATIATLLQTCKMNNVDPVAWLTQTLERIANKWPSAEIDALMPWNYKA